MKVLMWLRISYLGELWVLLEFETAKAKDSFRGKVVLGSVSSLNKLTPSCIPEEEEEDELSVEDNNDGRINDLDANNGIDEGDVEEVLETLFDQPDDQKDHSLSHPPGFTPEEGLNEGNNVNLDMKDYGENERDDNSFVNLDDVIPLSNSGRDHVHWDCLILFVEYDYVLFLFYLSFTAWKFDGFNKLVRDSWNVAPVNKKNDIRNFMGKLKFLKDRIRSWLSIHRSNSRGEIYFLKEELRSCDEVP
ncbi:hypothetical protein Tco_0886876 [Tanacetum coccineum]